MNDTITRRTMRFVALWVLPVAVILCGATGAEARIVRSTAAEAELVAEQTALRPGTAAMLGLRLKLDPGWHVYWKNAGDSGTPPSLALRLPDSYRSGELQFPFPHKIPIAHLVNYGFEGEVLLPIRVDVPADARGGRELVVQARADWLECKESCLPATAQLELTLPVASQSSPSRWSELFAATQTKLPAPLPDAINVVATRRDDRVHLAVGALADCARADFFPEREGVFVHAKITRLAGSGGGLRFELPIDTNATLPATLEGVIVCGARTPAARAHRLSAALAPVAIVEPPTGASSASMSIGLALGWALLGGLILNLMPCVFPILGLKVLGLARERALDGAARARHALVYLLGVSVCFGLLAGGLLLLRAAGEQIGWGFQLQSPWFVAALTVVFFVLALNLFGTLQWGAGVQSLAGRVGGGKSSAFLDGALAVLIASPCTAPFMGAAIGFALIQPSAVVFAVFAAIGLGMALPYMLLVMFPGWAVHLPRSGDWMESVRQFLAFPLLATVLWLVWVYGEQAGLSGAIRLMALLLALGLALWLSRRRAGRLLALAFALGIVAAGIGWLRAGMDAGGTRESARTSDAGWRPWSPAEFATLRSAGRPILIDFTAAWCVTCQVNKHAVLDTAQVADAMQTTGTIGMRADWTRRDDAITAALAALGRNGVPVYALYGANGRVTLLPEILTTAVVVAALERNSNREGGSP